MELSTIGEDGVPKSDHARSLFIKLQFIICKLMWPTGVVILNILMKTLDKPQSEFPKKYSVN